MVKHSHLPLGVPLGTPSDYGLYLTVYPLSRPNTDTVYLIEVGEAVVFDPKNYWTLNHLT